MPTVEEPARRGRALLFVAGAVGVLLLVAIVANVALARAAEQRAVERAGAAAGAPVQVRLSGWPVGFRVLTGRPVDVRISGRDLPLPDTSAVISHFEVDLVGVPLDFGTLGDPELELRAAHGRFVAELGEDAVQQLIGLVGRLPLTDVELRSGVARLNVARFPVLDATAEIDAGRVVFRLTAPVAAFARVELRLEALPFGLQSQDVVVRPGVLRLEGDASTLRLRRSP